MTLSFSYLSIDSRLDRDGAIFELVKGRHRPAFTMMSFFLAVFQFLQDRLFFDSQATSGHSPGLPVWGVYAKERSRMKQKCIRCVVQLTLDQVNLFIALQSNVSGVGSKFIPTLVLESSVS